MNTSLVHLLLVPLFLFAIGCGDRAPAESSCGPCGGSAIICATTLDDCIVQGHGSCATHAINDLTLTSDGITNGYTYVYQADGHVVAGTWTRVDRTIAFTEPGIQWSVRLYEGGETCPRK